jgi:hypothetical protein
MKKSCAALRQFLLDLIDLPRRIHRTIKSQQGMLVHGDLNGCRRSNP